MKRPGLAGLLLAGAAAYGLYKLSQLSDEERSDLVNKGKKLFDDSVAGLKEKLNTAADSYQEATNGRANRYAEDVNFGV